MPTTNNQSLVSEHSGYTKYGAQPTERRSRRLRFVVPRIFTMLIFNTFGELK